VTGGRTLLPAVHPDAPTTVLPVIPQEAPRKQRRWSDYGLLYGMGLGLLLLEPFLRGTGLVG